MGTGLAALLLAAAVFAATFQVLARFVLHQPAAWSEPATQTLVVWMAFLGLAGGFRQGLVLAIDFALRLSRGAWRRWLGSGIALAALLLFALIAWHGAQLAWRLRFQTLAGLGIPISFAYAAVPVGAACACLAVLARWLGSDGADDPPAAEADSP